MALVKPGDDPDMIGRSHGFPRNQGLLFHTATDKKENQRCHPGYFDRLVHVMPNQGKQNLKIIRIANFRPRPHFHMNTRTVYRLNALNLSKNLISNPVQAYLGRAPTH